MVVVRVTYADIFEVLHFVSQLDDTKFANKVQVIDILKQHGATLEGQDVSYQDRTPCPMANSAGIAVENLICPSEDGRSASSGT